MKKDGHLMLCTVKELAEYLASGIDQNRVLDNGFSDCDFAIIENVDGNDDLEYIKSGAMGWYGIKAVDTGFDSDCLILFSDYYGGGCAQFAQLWDEMACYKQNEVENVIKSLILDALTCQETANEDTPLIVAFALGG